MTSSGGHSRAEATMGRTGHLAGFGPQARMPPTRRDEAASAAPALDRMLYVPG